MTNEESLSSTVAAITFEFAKHPRCDEFWNRYYDELGGHEPTLEVVRNLAIALHRATGGGDRSKEIEYWAVHDWYLEAEYLVDDFMNAALADGVVSHYLDRIVNECVASRRMS